MKNNTPKLNLSKISQWLLLALAFLLPILVVPFTSNFLVHSKSFLIFSVALISMLLFLIHSFKNKSWEMLASPITSPLFLFGLATLASTFFTMPYPVDSLLGMGGIYLGIVLITLLGSSLIKSKKNYFVEVLSVSAIILAITSLLQLIGWGPSKLINSMTIFELPDNLLFNLSGSPFIAMQVMILALVANIAQVSKKKFVSTINMISIPILLFGLCLYAWSMLPGKIASITLPPLAASWSVALDSVRKPRSALIGQGSEAYVNIYKKFKPLWINGQDYWQFNFSSGANFPLTLIVTSGFIGLGTWALLAYQFTKKAILSGGNRSPAAWVAFTSFVLQLILPTNPVVLGLQAVALTFWVASIKNQLPIFKLGGLSAALIVKDQANSYKISKPNHWLINIVNSSLLIGLMVVAVLMGRAYLSYNQLYQANAAALEKDGVNVYNHQIKAITLNPYLDTSRRDYALTNLQIAVALSNKTDITEEEKTQVTQLISQAIRDARAATVLDEFDSQNYLVLAQIYKNLIGSNDEATQWTVNSYVSAIQNDPANPLLRVELGSIFFNAKQYSQAVNFFNQAISLKPDLPIGYFQLGRALHINQQLEQTKQAWQTALQLLPPESEDYKSVMENLEKLEAEIEEASKSAQLQGGQPTDPGGASRGGAGSTQGGAESEISPLGAQMQSLTEQNVEAANDPNLVNSLTEEPLDVKLEPGADSMGEEEVVGEDEQPVE